MGASSVLVSGSAVGAGLVSGAGAATGVVATGATLASGVDVLLSPSFGTGAQKSHRNNTPTMTQVSAPSRMPLMTDFPDTPMAKTADSRPKPAAASQQFMAHVPELLSFIFSLPVPYLVFIRKR
jgi:hypothetical protein